MEGKEGSEAAGGELPAPDEKPHGLPAVPDPARGRGVVRRLLPRVLAALLLAGWYALAVGSAWDKSPAFDETAHLAAGWSYWLTGDHRLQPENGWLPQRVGAAPLLLDRPAFPPLDSKEWRESDVWSVGRRFLFESGNDAQEMLRRSRAAMALFGVAAGLLVYLWSSALHGRAGGIVSLALFALCPLALGHGPLVTSDMAAAAAFLAATAALWSLLGNPGFFSVLVSGAALAALALSKPSALLILPVAILLGAAHLRERRRAALPGAGAFGAGGFADALVMAAALAAALLVAGGVVWAAYGFRSSPFVAQGPSDRLWPGWEWVLDGSGLPGRAAKAAADAGAVPEAWAYGVAHAARGAANRAYFAAGEVGAGGAWWYFPYAFAVKTPLATMGLLAIGAAAWLVPSGRGPGATLRRAAPSDAVPLLALVLVYGAASVAGGLNIGLRHMLPVLLALFVLAGAAGRWLEGRTLAGRLVVGGLLAALGASTLAARPHFLAYFHEAAGGPAGGWKRLVDSNLDWGQDLPALRGRLAAHPRAPGEVVVLGYFGTGVPSWYGIDAEPLLPGAPADPHAVEVPPLRAGVYAVSATVLQTVALPLRGPWTPERERDYLVLRGAVDLLRASAPGSEARRLVVAARDEDFWRAAVREFLSYRAARLCARLREREPDDHAGHSILIYRLDAAEAAAAEGP